MSLFNNYNTPGKHIVLYTTPLYAFKILLQYTISYLDQYSQYSYFMAVSSGGIVSILMLTLTVGHCNEKKSWASVKGKWNT